MFRLLVLASVLGGGDMVCTREVMGLYGGGNSMHYGSNLPLNSWHIFIFIKYTIR